MHHFLRLFTLLVAVSLVGCGAAIPTIKPYKMDIQQGNVVTSEMLLKLRPGMTKSQVRFILGTPLLVDSFHSNRWDYFYQLRKQGEIVNQRRVILDFDSEGLLKRVRGDVVPQGQTAEDVKKQLETEAADKGASTEADPNAPVIEKVETPEVDVVEQMPEASATESNLAPVPEAAGVPSVDAAPEPDIQAPEVEMKPEIEVPEVEKEAVIEAPAVEPIQKKELEANVVPDAVPVVSPSLKNVKDASKQSEPIKMAPDSSRVFRMDRQLDMSRAYQNQEPKPAAASEASVVQEVKDSAEVIPEEEDPSFFERMLEKIGF